MALGLTFALTFFNFVGAIGSALGLPPVFWINAAMMACGGLLARIRA